MIQSNLVRISRNINSLPVRWIAMSQVRCNSSATNLVRVDVSDKTGIATLTMNKLPVNSLSLELLSSISSNLTELENNKTRGLILASAGRTVFSAGIDINEMYKPEPKRLREFWKALQDVWIKLYGSSFPTAAAINGHAPAGGCFLSMACEYRVMLPNYTIGLNETQLGIVAPWWFMNTMLNTIPRREAEMALTLGTLFKSDQALKIGLIDEIATDKADTIARCEAFLLKQQKIPQIARTETKMSLRGADVQRLIDTSEKDIDIFVEFVNRKDIQKKLGLFINIMKVRSVFKSVTKPFGSIMKMFGGKSKGKK